MAERNVRLIHIAVATLFATACAGAPAVVRSQSPQPEPACAPPVGPMTRDARTESIAGQFRLTLVATSGARSGHAARGDLRLLLLPNPTGQSADQPGRPGRRVLYGSVSISLDSVGAAHVGSTQSMDQASPGVLVIETSRDISGVQIKDVVARFGAEGNRGDRLRFDGAYMSLFIDASAATRFEGRWTSGGGDGIGAAGYFCADRKA